MGFMFFKNIFTEIHQFLLYTDSREELSLGGHRGIFWF